jgi:excisionase family DNA binding protein
MSNHQPSATVTPLAYSIDQALELTQVSRSTLYSWINSGNLASVKIGGRRFIPRKALEALYDTTDGGAQ